MRMNKTQADELDRPVRLLKAVADPVRLRLLHLLTSRDEVCVCYLHEALELPQPTVSRHLAYLRKAGLVATRKEGLWVHYRLARPTGMLHRFLLGCIAEGLGDLDALKRDHARLSRIVGTCRKT
jgi:ArsR family transcriptional regulator